MRFTAAERHAAWFLLTAPSASVGVKEFFICVFGTALAPAAFARARAALLAAARLSGDHGVYLKSG